MNWTLIKSHQLEQKCHKSKKLLQTMIPCVRPSGIHLQFQAVARLQSDNPGLLHTQVIQGTRQENHRSTILSHAHYGNMGCGVFKRGVQNQKDFCIRINIPKGNYRILSFGLMASCQKQGIILVILSKNVNNKKCAPKLVFFNEKKLRKIQIIFDIEN